MHGLVNRSIQNFVQDVYGVPLWSEIATQAGLDGDGFEAMLTYEDTLTYAVIDMACARLNKSRSDFLEDLGTYLISHPNMWRIRRLLRFGGADLVDFLESIGDLPDRARLAIPDFEVPTLRVEAVDPTNYVIDCENACDGVEHVMLGCLRAMADDYGALAIVQTVELPHRPNASAVEIMLLSTSFAAGNSFMLTEGR
ncbi:heme NO-binding domain-containing protein [Palleronia sp. LCG004]|uniref:heme NO-binding domain-containing protein n=1 Tax=Palleronia sp. LCG004 TaxID=3079304 RepID=UPI002943DCDC|nr:heme NO-binding domain-containing protein [Palleronia sp. LCG004]WOI57590.1 heme NO-binding domain-containing protein [Palleronia sp. LCG004]